MLIAKLRCSHKSCTNTPEYGCSKQFRCAAHNAAHIKDVRAKQIRLLKAQELSSLERKPPRAPCLGVPKSDDNPNGEHSTTLLRLVTEVRKGIAQNAALSKWADKREMLVTVTPPPTDLEGGEDDPPALIQIDASEVPLLPTPLPLDANSSSASPSPSPSPLIPTQDKSALPTATPTPTLTNAALIPAPTTTNAGAMPAPHPQTRIPNPQTRYVEISSFFHSQYFI